MIGVICGLVLAFILTMFGVDKIFINELQPLFANVTLTTGAFLYCNGSCRIYCGN